MNVRQRVLEARLAEKAGKNPSLAQDMGIEIRYEKDSTKRKTNDKRSADKMRMINFL